MQTGLKLSSEKEKNPEKRLEREIALTIAGVTGALRNKEKLSDKESEELAKQVVNDFYRNDGKLSEKESELEAHENRSRAMLGNQNARKMGLTEEEIDYVNGEIERFETVISTSAKKKGFTEEQVAQYIKDTLRNTLMNN